jgi:hypothetical protein
MHNGARDASLSFFTMMIAANVIFGMIAAIIIVFLVNCLIYLGQTIIGQKNVAK